MAIFPQLAFEAKIQVGDKIRLYAKNSFVSKGSTAISAMTIKPSDDVSAISVFDADSSLRYLDWAYSDFSIDIDTVNNYIDFEENGVTKLATLTNGTYDLDDLVLEIKTQMDSSGDNTYTVTVSSDDKITISADGTFNLIPGSANILGQLGFATSTSVSLSNSSSYTGKRVRYMKRKVTLSVTSGMSSETLTDYINVYSEEGDNLFSNDSDLFSHEPDILKWLPEDKSSFKYAHRRAQELILAFLDEKGYTDIYQNKLLIDAIVDITEVSEWSKFLALKIIFQGMKNAVDDVFGQKADTYNELEKNARNRVILRLDKDNDGLVEDNSSEGVMISTIACARR